MFKSKVSWIMLTLLLALSLLTFAFNIEPVKSEPTTIYVDDDNTSGPWDGTPEHPYQNITSALEHTSANDTLFVYNGTYYENIHVNKSVSLVGEDKHGTIINGNFTGTVVAITADNVNVANFTIRNARAQPPVGYGVSMNFSKNCNISNSIITNNLLGIRLWNSSNNTIADNQVFCPQDKIGVALYLSDDNTLTNNTIPSVYVAIFFSSSNHNRLRGNKLYSNWYGIRLRNSSNNTIVANKISNNSRGIHIVSYTRPGINNLVYHNNFVNNAEQAVVYNSTNIWHSGYPSGGNYWSDYKDRYPNATEIDDSGIWDTPYVIDESNQDNYPLMSPWASIPPAIDATVDIIPNTLNLRSKVGYVTAFIEFPEGYNVSSIDVFTIMLNGTIPVDSEDATQIGDYDNDGIPDLMILFNRTTLADYIVSKGVSDGNVTLVLSGNLHDRWKTQFTGYYVMPVSSLTGDVNCDGVVNIYDVVEAASSYGANEDESNWNPNANPAPPYNRIDIYDLVTIASHYGETTP